MSAARCPHCGTRRRPNPLPWLLLPLLLGGAALLFMLRWGRQMDLGVAVLVVTLPFAGFLVLLRQFTLAWSAVDDTRCRSCGQALQSEAESGS